MISEAATIVTIPANNMACDMIAQPQARTRGSHKSSHASNSRTDRSINDRTIGSPHSPSSVAFSLRFRRSFWIPTQFLDNDRPYPRSPFAKTQIVASPACFDCMDRLFDSRKSAWSLLCTSDFKKDFDQVDDMADFLHDIDGIISPEKPRQVTRSWRLACPFSLRF